MQFETERHFRTFGYVLHLRSTCRTKTGEAGTNSSQARKVDDINTLQLPKADT